MSPFVAPAEATLDEARLHRYDQLQTNWCWAAASQMTVEYLRPQTKTEQCKIAGEEIGATGSPFMCCPLVLTCNVGKWPQKVFHDRHIDFDRKGKALTENELKTQIAKGSPVLFSWNWKKGNSHMLVAVAYRVIDGETFIDVLDPLNIKKNIPYSEYDSSEDHTHSIDYYAFRDMP